MLRYLFLILIIKSVQNQSNTCSCSCCRGPNCAPTVIGTINVQTCTLDSCRMECRRIFPQCQTDNSFTQILPQCSMTDQPLYRCQCYCCRTGSPTCLLSYVGQSSAYTCEIGACSIACANQYPNQCVSDGSGQVQGNCSGPIATTSTTSTSVRSSTIDPISSNRTCLCRCCQTGSNCNPNIEIGIAFASQCSSDRCTESCHTRYPSQCPSSASLGQSRGECIDGDRLPNQRQCQCQCCQSPSCTSYGFNVNDTCAICEQRCRQLAPCTDKSRVTFTCSIGTKIYWNRITLVAWFVVYVYIQKASICDNFFPFVSAI